MYSKRLCSAQLGYHSAFSLFLPPSASSVLSNLSPSAQQLAHTSVCLGVSLCACQLAWASSVLTVWCTVSGRQERPWGNTLLPYQRLILSYGPQWTKLVCVGVSEEHWPNQGILLPHILFYKRIKTKTPVLPHDIFYITPPGEVHPERTVTYK